MLKKIEEFLSQKKLNSTIKNQKKLNENLSTYMFSRDKNLKKYVKSLKTAFKTQNQFIFDYQDRVDIEHNFGRLIAIRLSELSKSVMFVISLDYTYSAIPLMRSLCDSLLLLKYVEKNPEYIIRFMRKEGRGINVSNIKKEIDDEKLKEYYNFLSEYMHSNPVSIKSNYYILPDKKRAILLNNPQTGIYNEAYIISLLTIIEESNRLLHEIFSKNWKNN